MCVLISEFYEQLLILVFSLTGTQISPKMWQVFVMVKDIFDTDGFDYFTGLFLKKGAVKLLPWCVDRLEIVIFSNAW